MLGPNLGRRGRNMGHHVGGNGQSVALMLMLMQNIQRLERKPPVTLGLMALMLGNVHFLLTVGFLLVICHVLVIVVALVLATCFQIQEPLHQCSVGFSGAEISFQDQPSVRYRLELMGLFNVAESHGNKAVLGSGRDRLQTFAQWVFRQQKDVVVVYGHSLWFRAFCRDFFPHDVHHEAKTIKVSNCGVVTFILQERIKGGGESAQYSIRPDSFQQLI
ncbi:hypothetical protein BBO99_00003475 [Phytophthora kernoviae]|uniref:Uncharacterized protein n=2 Tax=Phytophthora kernoviae TaxID=325452 RepID=A0A3R7FXZ6_9STRA|nr:hypothetical protein G195_007262 [Phytophthora kernoviae 00238/432]KAG2529486.1 hypothetical protein JM18_002767 [Phytophthora kernoviae]RLN02742.1 hypothetical protein BBI17_003503 [Phytophthora kernoviae]RLN81722.1 hypothetical protein BBO99_00003475 [Phytophthora kernoviae]